MTALAGLKVLDLSILVQGPQAAQMLHDMGAEVIKIELPGIGDVARWVTASPTETRSGFFIGCNRGKRSVALDLRTSTGKEAFERLAATADVVIANFQPGTLERWGLGYERLADLNPGLILATGSVYGSEGPDALQEGTDLMGQSAGGLVASTGEDGAVPTPVGAVIADHLASLNLTIGILAALNHRHATGRGQWVESSLLGGQIWAQASEYTHYLVTGEEPGRANRGHPLIKGLYGIFRTADGWIAVAGVTADRWRGFCETIGRPAMADDLRWTARIDDPDDRRKLDALLDDAFGARPTAEWCALLKASEQRCAPVRGYADVVASEQPWANGYLARHDGDVTTIGFPIRFSETPAVPGREAPMLGAHTVEVLTEHGFTGDEIAALSG